MSNNYRSSFYLLTSLFFMWGLITVLVDSLIPRLREIFELSYFEAGLVQFAFFIAYGIVSIPAGYLLHKIGYKKGIIYGLSIMGLACLLFIPAASMRLFPLFLLSYFLLAGGMTILQVAANPFVTVLGEPSKASSRLNLSQAFNSLGTTIAPAVGAIFILSDNILNSEEISQLDESARTAYFDAEASAVANPFLVLALALFLLAFVVLRAQLPKLMNTDSKGNYFETLKNKKLLFGAVSIFLYVGAEVAIGSYLVNYFLDMKMDIAILENDLMRSIAASFHEDVFTVDKKAIVASFVTFYWGLAMVGRFLGSYLTRVYRANSVLYLFGFFAVVSILISMFTGGFIAMWAIIFVGFFNSIMFPTIFSLAIEDLGDNKAEGSGILCTAIAGGAFIPPLYGLFTDLSGFKPAMLLLIICYAFIVFYAKKIAIPKTA